MSSIPIGIIVVTLLFGSAMLAMGVARYLPNHQLSPESKSAVSVSMAVVGTLSALVVGLLISSTNTSFTAKSHQVAQMSTDVIGLDRLLQRYGPETQEIHALLRQYVAASLADLFPTSPHQAPDLENNTTLSMLEAVQDKTLALAPASEAHRWLQAQALQVTNTIMAGRWQLVQENSVRTPRPLVILMLFWFVIIFASFGLFAPRNLTSIVAILLCSIGIGSAIRMTSELQTPFTGIIRISSTPLAHALEVIDH